MGVLVRVPAHLTPVHVMSAGQGTTALYVSENMLIYFIDSSSCGLYFFHLIPLLDLGIVACEF